MSSTNRGGVREVSDYYVTPQSDVRQIVTLLQKVEPTIFSGPILDPCAGGDIYDQMSYPTVLSSLIQQEITTVDIREDSRAEIKADFLRWTPTREFQTVITNPPFALAMQIITQSLKIVQPDGFVVMLLRLNFFGSASRFKFMQESPPKYCFVHHKRMSFTGGTTDSIEYMHAVWQKGYTPEYTMLKVI